VPGCGIAAYGILLILFFLVGVTGMVLSSAALMQAGNTVGPSRLLAGGNVAVWRLQPMRDAQVLALTEVPMVWHDESAARDGTVACALTERALVRVEDGQGFVVPYAIISEVRTLQEGDITILETYQSDGAALTCFFRKDEGGDRMGRMLRSEAGRASQN
jgi:hypothetical protein